MDATSPNPELLEKATTPDFGLKTSQDLGEEAKKADEAEKGTKEPAEHGHDETPLFWKLVFFLGLIVPVSLYLRHRRNRNGERAKAAEALKTPTLQTGDIDPTTSAVLQQFRLFGYQANKLNAFDPVGLLQPHTEQQRKREKKATGPT